MAKLKHGENAAFARLELLLELPKDSFADGSAVSRSDPVWLGVLFVVQRRGLNAA
jgi:hypothetical protein